MTEAEIMDRLTSILVGENLKQSQRIDELTGVPRSGEFHHRLAVEGGFGVFERMQICHILERHIKGEQIINNLDDMFDEKQDELLDQVMDDTGFSLERGRPGTGKRVKINFPEREYTKKKCFECGLPVQDENKEFCNYCYSIMGE